MSLILLSVLKEVAWSFLGKRVLMKAAFGVLAWGASQTDNKLDDEIVAEAKARYEGKKDKPDDSNC